MKAGYNISNRGCDKPDYILVYNWEQMNEVDNAGYFFTEKDKFIIGINLNTVAIFKIHYK